MRAGSRRADRCLRKGRYTRDSPRRVVGAMSGNGALLTLSGQTAFGRNWLNTCRSTLSPGTWWILFHAVLDFGDSGSGTFFIKVSTGRTADTDPPDSVSADHDGYATDCIGDVG